MKRNLIALLCMAVALTLCAPLAAQAASLGPHDNASGNPCKQCHDTARGVASLRGWTSDPVVVAGVAWVKNISALCYTCHDAVGAFNANPMRLNAYDNGSHGFDYDTANGFYPATPDGAYNNAPVTGSGLPYTSVTTLELECTSCHNVHVSDVYPYNQRGDIQTLCNTCHPGRVNDTPLTGGANSHTTATGQARGGITGYSTHPTTVTVTDTANADVVAPTDPGRGENLIQPYTPVTSADKLGGHMDGAGGTGGNFTCQTCHAVHGPTMGTSGINDLLVIDNTTTGAVTGSLLCEECHEGGRDGTFNNVGPNNPGDNVTSWGDHPIDLRPNRPFYPTGVSIPDGTTAADWTTAGTPNNDRGAQPFLTGLAPACSSCHDTHGGINNTALLRGPSLDAAGAADWDVFSYDEWCFVCHLSDEIIPNNHHSNVNNMHAVNTIDGYTDEYTSLLACGDCHGADGVFDWRAHNGFWTWVAGSEPAVGNSDFCEACHTAANPSVLLASGLKGQDLTAANGNLPATHGTNRGTSSHQTNSIRDLSNPNYNMTPDWSFASGGTSEWDTSGAQDAPICESCHNILTNGISVSQGLKQGWKANILLAPYEDDDSATLVGAEIGPSGAADSHDFYGGDDATLPVAYVAGDYSPTGAGGNTGVSFCRACHQAAGDEFVHNPYAHTMEVANYTYAANTEPYGRSTNTILTTPNDSTTTDCPEVSTADQQAGPTTAGVAPGGLSYPATNAVDCDSCHRPHNADSQSVDGNRYLILEITDTNWGTDICAECHDHLVQCNQ